MTPNPRVIETDHMMRRGSAASMMSVDSHGRRYTQPHLRDIEEDYAMMSMSSPAHADTVAKRRRVNGSGGYMPGSPPMGYVPYPGAGDLRYPQQAHGQLNHRPSFSGGGVGPPAPYQGNMTGASSLPRPPTSGVGGVPQQVPYRSNNGMVEMQPPPRPSISYPGPAVQASSRPGGFDESLRLPPLQTQLPNSPNMNSAVEASVGSAHPNTTMAGLGIMQNVTPQQSMQQQQPQPQQQPVMRQSQQVTQTQQTQQPPRQHQQPHSSTPPPSRWAHNFLFKLNMLRAISPPLRVPAPGAPPFETRGPIIAIEGVAGAPGVLKEVAVVVEKALSISGECVVRTWNGPGVDEHHGDSTNLSSSKEQDTGGKINNPAGETHDVQGSGSQSFANPMANYISQMLKWHHTSEELVKFVTTHPTGIPASSDNSGAAADSTEPLLPSSNKIPVAVLGTGYSLTQSDRYAAALPMTDAYQTEDHWKWVATLWRGIIGPDLTIYVKLCTSADEIRGNNCVEFASPTVVVLRVPAPPAAAAAASDTATGVPPRTCMWMRDWNDGWDSRSWSG
ncbi:Mating-type protein a-1 [Apiospora kogelbergensis]|uniref:Mating-type protein a-1 n=1 Tax=Apiospora kogelbergensis TaxID=1337665 RepID=A0AAW0R837_9PEZI